MTNRIAVWLFLILGAGVLADLFWNEGSALFFLAQKFLGLIEWVVFWR